MSSLAQSLRSQGWFVAFGVFAAVGVLTGCDPEAEHLQIVPDPSPADTISVVAGALVPPDHGDVTYTACETNCVRNQLDIYLPEGPAVGTIVFFHGGGFDSGAKELVIVMGLIKSQTERGWAVVTPNYRLAQAGVSDSRDRLVSDARAAMRWTASDEAIGLGLPSTGPRLVAGHSAGGSIAGIVATTTNDGSIDGWISISGVLDWQAGPGSSAAADALHGGADYQLSPAELMTAATPPGYIIHGDQDDVVEWLNLIAAGLATLSSGTPNLTFDLVDHAADGSSLGYARGHIPLGGANATRFNSWLDSHLAN